MAATPDYKKGREEGYDGVTSREIKHREIHLIPQPSCDPRDPLVSPSFSQRFCGPNLFPSERTGVLSTAQRSSELVFTEESHDTLYAMLGSLCRYARTNIASARLRRDC